MDEPFTLLDPQEAQFFLQRLPRAARGKGESFFRNGQVLNLRADDPGMAYSADVRDGQLYRVKLFYDPDRGWDGSCACGQEFKCEHVFAAMNALLAEHRSATVRTLSSNRAGVAGAMAAARRREQDESSALGRRLMVTLERPLTREEAKYVRQIHTIYLRCKQNRRITSWDFREMGFNLGGNPEWEALRIWPAFPADEHEFWLYVAAAAQGQGLEFPEFMLPITDLTPIQGRLTRWRRAEEVQQWSEKLRVRSMYPEPSRAELPGQVDLRISIGAREARLEWKRPGQENFEAIKHGQSRQLRLDYDAGRVELTMEAELLWHLYQQVFPEGYRSDFRYFDAEQTQAFGRLLRARQLESRIVNTRGEQLPRPAQSLRWEMKPAENEMGNYSLRLVQADGAPLPELVCIVPGRPTIYVTPEAIFTGPQPMMNVLDPQRENQIPAGALEQDTGATFLQSLGLELPPRIRERLQVLPLRVTIDCALKPVYPGSNAEDCVVTVTAEAPDGQRQTWSGGYWSENNRPHSRKRSSASEQIVVYDRESLEKIPALLEPLNLKSSDYVEGLTLRVTKKFPEVFAAWLKTVPPDIEVRLAGELQSLANGDIAGRVSLEVTEAEIDWFDLRVVLNVSDTTLTASEIKLLLNAKGNFVRLEGKGWRRLRYDLSQDEDQRLARLGLSPRELSAEPQRLHALQLADEAAHKFLPQKQVAQVQRRAAEIKTRVTPALPSSVTAQLRPYQLEGFHFLAYLATNRFGGILADDMGLGKTLQTLAWLVWLRESRQKNGSAANGGQEPTERQPNGALTASLVVCPKSVMDNWQAEAARFTPGLRVRVWSASELPNLTQELASADLHVVNYTQLRSVGEGLANVTWLALILDEGQYIKNPNSQTAQIARALIAEYRLVLSGTPIENRLLDLWSLMAFAMPGVLSNRAQFARIYDAKDDPLARRRLASRVRPFVLRRTKSQVARDLPDRIEEDLFCEIEGEQQTLYRAELKRAQQLLLGVKTQKELAQFQFNFLTSLLRLRQICCHPRLVNPQSQAPSAKAEALLEQLEPLMEEGQKVLVFSQFVELLHLLRPMLAEREWPLFYLAGETENRGALVEKFQKAEGPGIFLISLKAGGFGLNLTAASYVVLFDPWWNPAVENQAIDRTHRIGQTNKVVAYRLLIKNSIEEKIRQLQKQKSALASDVLGEEKFAQSLTLDDLRFLFSS